MSHIQELVTACQWILEKLGHVTFTEEKNTQAMPYMWRGSGQVSWFAFVVFRHVRLGWSAWALGRAQQSCSWHRSGGKFDWFMDPFPRLNQKPKSRKWWKEVGKKRMVPRERTGGCCKAQGGNPCRESCPATKRTTARRRLENYLKTTTKRMAFGSCSITDL